MSNARHIEILSDDEALVARVFLAVRALRGRLAQPWFWGDEVRADLLLVDTATLAGRIALLKAHEAGKRCAALGDPSSEAGVMHLGREFSIEDLLALLAVAAGPPAGTALRNGMLEHRSSDFFADFDDAPLEIDPAVEALGRMFEEAPAPIKPPPGIDEAEALLKAAAPPPLDALRLDAQTAVEYTGEGSARSAARLAARAGLGAREVGTAAAGNVDPAFRRAAAAGRVSHALRDYLGEGLLGGAASIALDGAPVLMLDPKLREYRAEGDLTDLVQYCTEPLRVDAFRALTTPELADWRARVPAQPYARLAWYWHLVHGRGVLASHLDPGGAFRLTRWFQIARELPRQYRISTAMLRPARLHEICAASGTTMAEVFDVVNAYDAVGYVECQPRERLRGNAT